MDRATLDAAVMQNQESGCTVNARPEVGGHEIQLTRKQFLDLISVHLGDWLQQVGHASWLLISCVCHRLDQRQCGETNFLKRPHYSGVVREVKTLGFNSLKLSCAQLLCLQEGKPKIVSAQWLLSDLWLPMQVEMEATMTNEAHGWTKKGDAWGYRRGAYRRMAEILGGRYLELYKEVFTREPLETRNIHQQFHPKPRHMTPVA